MRQRDPKRFSRILLARADRVIIPVEIIPLEAVPTTVLRSAALPRPRRAKGVAKARRIY
jgi:hypothetical protein